MIWILVAIGWILCGAGGYLLFRQDFISDGLGWTVGDRKIGICMALACGPFMMIVGVMFFVLKKIWDSSDKPAKW